MDLKFVFAHCASCGLVSKIIYKHAQRGERGQWMCTNNNCRSTSFNKPFSTGVLVDESTFNGLLYTVERLERDLERTKKELKDLKEEIELDKEIEFEKANML